MLCLGDGNMLCRGEGKAVDLEGLGTAWPAWNWASAAAPLSYGDGPDMPGAMAVGVGSVEARFFEFGVREWGLENSSRLGHRSLMAPGCGAYSTWAAREAARLAATVMGEVGMVERRCCVGKDDERVNGRCAPWGYSLNIKSSAAQSSSTSSFAVAVAEAGVALRKMDERPRSEREDRTERVDPAAIAAAEGRRRRWDSWVGGPGVCNVLCCG